MRLQSDPTVIYALTGRSRMDRSLVYSDLRRDHPYNTYVRDGLPPGPICNPGRAAILAVLHPERTEYFYFVADDSGGHVFSKNYAEHLKKVENWRKIQARAKTDAGRK